MDDGEVDTSLTRSEIKEFVLDTIEEEFEKRLPAFHEKLTEKTVALEKILKQFVEKIIDEKTDKLFKAVKVLDEQLELIRI